MSFFTRLFGKATKSSDIAKQRLQLVIIQDRMKLPPDVMDNIRDEIITVISKYVDVDVKGIDITVTQTANHSRLIADIPIINYKLTVS
ncbi:MAG: cell division topological specificity factor MinE [Anaerolineaceae bacterium 4572_78]|nr:MAG: cell division topological specificity factor MinE [Anaerolineaceae bacterium 4572_78]